MRGRGGRVGGEGGGTEEGGCEEGRGSRSAGRWRGGSLALLCRLAGTTPIFCVCNLHRRRKGELILLYHAFPIDTPFSFLEFLKA